LVRLTPQRWPREILSRISRMIHSKDRQEILRDAHFRFAVEADIKNLVVLINAAFVVEQIAIAGDRIDWLGAQKYMGAGRFVVLEQADSLLGCVYVETRGQRGYLGLLAVHPAQQGHGIGRRLANEADIHFRKEGCRAVDIRVISARSELVAFYEKLGFALQGTSAMPETAPLKIPCHYIHMSKNL
jgi:GNAT superfamily N-acetyltransferase